MGITPAIATIIGSLISGVVALVVSAFQNNKSMALVEYKIDELKKQVEKHNCLVERMVKVEEGLKANWKQTDKINDRLGIKVERSTNE